MKTIPLSQGKVALVDDADFDAVSQFKWHAYRSKSGRFYAARNIRKPDGRRTNQYLHQFLMPGESEIDHRDGNGLNNQRYNLRSVTHIQNLRGFRQKRLGTTSRFRGVHWLKANLKWRAAIKLDGRGVHLGLFTEESDAARAYDVAAKKFFGDFAFPNFE